MSETPVVVVPRKGVYVDGDGRHGRFYRHHRSFHDCTSLLLRILTAAATAAAVIVMLKATQTRDTPYGYIRGRWRDYPAYKWFIVANSVVFVYSVLAAIIACAALLARRGPLSYSGTAFLTLLADLLATCAIISAASAALAVALIARNGQYTGATWPTFCNYVTRFCDYAQGAIIASFCAFAFLALHTLLDASALHFHRRRQVL